MEGKRRSAGLRSTGQLVAGQSRALLVEDDTDLREFLTRLLTGDGWLVRAVADAETALELTSGPSNVPDVVITDVVLPGLDGLALIEQLRRQPATKRSPMIVLTARHGAHDRRPAHQGRRHQNLTPAAALPWASGHGRRGRRCRVPS